jgi:hypothetical protein
MSAYYLSYGPNSEIGYYAAQFSIYPLSEISSWFNLVKPYPNNRDSEINGGHVSYFAFGQRSTCKHV